jgi:hypothetical protein
MATTDWQDHFAGNLRELIRENYDVKWQEYGMVSRIEASWRVHCLPTYQAITFLIWRLHGATD